MQEVSRIRRFIDKSTGKVNLPQKTIEGVVHLQPRLHAPIDSLPTLLVIVTFPVTYLKVVLPRLPQLQSTVIAPQTKHLEDVQRVRMASEALPFAVPRVIPMPSIKYGLEVVLPTLAEIPQSQASLKEGALLQPAKHPLLPDSQYLWQVTLVQQKEFGSYEAHQNSRAIIPLTEAKANSLHSALRTDYACSRLSPESSSAYTSKDDQSKRPIEANLGRRRCNSTPLTSSNVSTTTLMRLVPRPECGKHLQSTMPVNKPKSKKSWHTSGQGNNQTTRINGRNSNGRSDLGIQAGVKVGTNQPAVHPLDGTRKDKDRSWLAVTLPREKKKKKLLPAREYEPVAHQSRDYEPAGGGVPPSTPLLPC